VHAVDLAAEGWQGQVSSIPRQSLRISPIEAYATRLGKRTGQPTPQFSVSFSSSSFLDLVCWTYRSLVAII